MYSRKMAGKMKRALAGFLAAGLVLSGMPVSVAEAANVSIEQEMTTASESNPDGNEETGGLESGKPDDNGSSSEEKPGGGSGSDTKKPGDGGSSSGDNQQGGGDAGSNNEESGNGENGSEDGKPGDDEGNSNDNKPEDGEGGSENENPGDGENDSNDNKPGDGETGSDEQNPEEDEEDPAVKPGEEDKDLEDDDTDKEESKEDISEEVSDYNVQISENSLSEKEPELVWKFAEGGGSYQEGAFSVPNENSGLGNRRKAASLEKAQQSVEDLLYEEIKKKTAEIDVSEYNILSSDISAVVIGVVNDHPDLYFARTGCGWSSYPGSDKVVTVRPVYIEGLDDEKFKKGVQDALASVKPGMTELEKAIALHDYLVLNCEYDDERLSNGTIPNSSYSAYGVLADNIAVCQGYALAYKYLLSQVGIEECYMVTSDAMNHAWNLIKLGDSYYQVDVTWDDPVNDAFGLVGHNNMFVSDAAFQAGRPGSTKTHHNWVVTKGSSQINLTAVDTGYDSAFWVEVKSPLVLDGHKCYYIDKASGIVRRESLTADIFEEMLAASEIGSWKVPNEPGYIYGNKYSGLFQLGNRLYFNSPDKIRSVSLDDRTVRDETGQLSTSDRVVYGCAYLQGEVKYVLQDVPHGEISKRSILTATFSTPVYQVVFNVQGNGIAPGNYTGITAGSTIVKPTDPTAEGFIFDGWYTDADCNTAWDFDADTVQGNLILYAKWISKSIELQEENVSFKGNVEPQLIYDGTEQTPGVVVAVDGTELKEGTDYTLSYQNNKNASTSTAKATVTVTAKGDSYSGTVSKEFVIGKAPLTITANDIVIQEGESIAAKYGYTVTGLMQGDSVTTPPSYQCMVTNSEVGEYPEAIKPSGAKVGNEDDKDQDNYVITYENGKLTITKKPVESFKVTFDMQGHGTALEAVSVEKGSTITKPTDPTAEGFTFRGWFKNVECTDEWDFVTDTVQEDITLYAKWTQNDVTLLKSHISIEETALVYDKTAKEPKVTVTVSDKTLTVGTDYELSYENNINAGTNAVAKVVGKGNYTGTVSKSFEIKKAPITLKALDKTIYVGDPLPAESEYAYEIAAGALMGNDAMTKGPSYTCEALDSVTAGKYKIGLSGAKIGSDGEDNYEITYEEGTLTIAERPDVFYKVTFNMHEHGDAPNGYDSIGAGLTLNKPADPVADGYIFEGWYKDEAYESAWDFANDTVTKDLTLHAKWREIVSLTEKAVISFAVTPDFTYNGNPHTPAVTVEVADQLLAKGTDYDLSYENNTNAGKTAKVIVTGKGAYKGTAEKVFEIKKAPLTIKAKDVTIQVDGEIPKAYEYDVIGLVEGDSLEEEPTLTCAIVDPKEAKEYAIIPSGAEAGNNYEIVYKNGTLTVVDEYVYYTVTFDEQGHGTAPALLTHVRAGSKIEKPEEPSEAGYRFIGWYREAACVTAWDFENDTVEKDLTLYAKWEKEPVSLAGADISFTEETDFTYNGKAQEPKVSVLLSSDMLTEGRDYRLTYADNTNAGTATVTVSGIGDYNGTATTTFQIKPAPVTVWAKDTTILVGTQLPADSYEYGCEGFIGEDEKLLTLKLTCDADRNVEGEYEIKISDADAGKNYVLTCISGKLRVVAELTSHTVTFDVQGHGTAPAGYTDVAVGSTIKKPADPEAEGYRFGGWYQDQACTMAWNFDRDTVQADLILYAKWEQISAVIEEEDVTLEKEVFTYDGTRHRPKAVVTVGGVTLVEGQDYRVTYKENRDVGIARVHVFGLGSYSGTVTKYFKIEGITLVIRARDMSILKGDPIPAVYEYDVVGLMEGDALTKEPSFTCSIESTAKAEQYDIVPFGAEAGKNYTITYEAGILTVADEYVSCTVTFDMQGHGAPVKYVGVKIGSTIDRPIEPEAEGYRFDGWYQDAACTAAWDFDEDIVQNNLRLYAKWLQLATSGSQDGFAVQEITDIYYTGKPCKPAVSVYDGRTLLKAGRDYQIKYYNNTNANQGNVRKTGNGAGANFNASLPYAEIIGKGNYTETVRVNFNILRAPIGDGGSSPSAGVTLKVKDQLVTSARGAQKPFSSIKYVKAMRLNVDYTLSLAAVNAKDASGGSVTSELSGAAVPAGYSGEFLLTIAGQGNYDGSICKTIHVADNAHLMKNAVVTLGKNQKNVAYTGKAVELKAGEVASADTFIVKCGKVVLKPEQDYTVSYRGNDRAGKAELIITGAGAYAGSKTVTFNIKGAPFSTRTVSVSGIEDKAFTGRAWTQNNAVLTYNGSQPLVYGTDYTINYSRNVNKGTATMTFKGVDKAGYSGSFKKTFKITAADINRVSKAEDMEKLSFEYCKAGVKPSDEIVLTDQSGYRLKNGKDYTLRYANNKKVAKITDPNPPMVIVKGKGNYTGEFAVPFEIVKADLRTLTVKTTPTAYKNNRKDDYVYKPAVKLFDGKASLREGKDYEITYHNNTQADYAKYIQNQQKSADDTATSENYGGAPVAVIKGRADSLYSLEGVIVVSLPIYQKQLKKTEFRIVPETALYTGGQVRPAVKVYYGNELLVEDKDYTVSYGANIKSGKKQGSVTISGIAPKYGGSITEKFDIVRKPITY